MWLKPSTWLSQLLEWDVARYFTHSQWHNYTMCAGLVSISQNLKHHCLWMCQLHTQLIVGDWLSAWALLNPCSTREKHQKPVEMPGFTQCFLRVIFFFCFVLHNRQCTVMTTPWLNTWWMCIYQMKCHLVITLKSAHLVSLAFSI